MRAPEYIRTNEPERGRSGATWGVVFRVRRQKFYRVLPGWYLEELQAIFLSHPIMPVSPIVLIPFTFQKTKRRNSVWR